MTQKPDVESILKMTTEIAVAYLNHNSIGREDISQLIRDVRSALEDSGEVAAIGRQKPASVSSVARDAADQSLPEQYPALVAATTHIDKPTPAVPVEDSVHDDYIISLEDGGRFRSLRRHLMAKYGMTPDDYRRKWNLPHDYPMVAPSYARDRSEVAKRIGLGRKPTTAGRRAGARARRG
jgi:predicted transcriptional regulator